jgi:hypothetical protein
MRAAGMPSDTSANVDLGQNTPEKNSVSGNSPANPHVISETVDGSGAVITHASEGNDCTSQWVARPGAGVPAPLMGSVDITLSDAGGNEIFIRPIQICQNGISGKIFGLFSDFIPDP